MMPAEAPGGAPSASGGVESQRSTRYAHLVGRLRARQITMEEATELFGIMQGMLRVSEIARAAAARPAAVLPTAGVTLERAPRTPAAPSAPDDMFLVGLLAMGAGAGLLAAMAKRLADVTPAGSAERGNRSELSSSPR